MRLLWWPLMVGLLPLAGCVADPVVPQGSSAAQTPAARAKAKRQELIIAIGRMGGEVRVDAATRGEPVVLADLHSIRGPAAVFHGLDNPGHVLDALGPLTKLRELNLYDTAFTDADLDRLRGLASLQVLNLAATQVTDAGLPCLQTLPNLRELNLNDTPVTDTGLRSLQGLSRLRVLGLFRTRVTDEGLAQIGGMKNLQELTLGSSSITDRGLVHLKGLRDLRKLTLAGSRVTDGGIKDLMQALPQVKILH